MSLLSELQDAEKKMLQDLRALRRQQREHAPNAKPVSDLTVGQKFADWIAARMGSWPFIIIQSIILAIWVTLNLLAAFNHWDPYPFILLNLMLSFQAAYAAPIIMMSQNRQQDIDRKEAENDHQINIKAELEIELVHQKLDALRENEILLLTQTVADLTELLKRSGVCEPDAKPGAKPKATPAAQPSAKTTTKPAAKPATTAKAKPAAKPKAKAAAKPKA